MMNNPSDEKMNTIARREIIDWEKYNTHLTQARSENSAKIEKIKDRVDKNELYGNFQTALIHKTHYDLAKSAIVHGTVTHAKAMKKYIDPHANVHTQ
jgi:hypothetical protein